MTKTALRPIRDGFDSVAMGQTLEEYMRAGGLAVDYDMTEGGARALLQST